MLFHVFPNKHTHKHSCKPADNMRKKTNLSVARNLSFFSCLFANIRVLSSNSLFILLLLLIILFYISYSIFFLCFLLLLTSRNKRKQTQSFCCTKFVNSFRVYLSIFVFYLPIPYLFFYYFLLLLFIFVILSFFMLLTFINLS